MSFASTAAVLAAVRTRIEALVPATQAHPDDLFSVDIGLRMEQRGSRSVLLQARGGIRAREAVNCKDWDFDLLIYLGYQNLPPNDEADEAQAGGVFGMAIADDEQIVADLYSWAVTTDGIRRIIFSPSDLTDAGDGTLQVLRQAQVQYDRT